MMGKVSRLTVYFEEPFWVGVFERIDSGTLSAARIVFGAEPKDYDIYDLVLRRYDRIQFSPAVAVVSKPESKNPKRIQREARRQLQDTGVGTKAQQALKLQREAFKQERTEKSRAQKEEELRREFERKQQKKREKHKGH